jgi:hypothetical protein
LPTDDSPRQFILKTGEITKLSAANRQIRDVADNHLTLRETAFLYRFQQVRADSQIVI